jgi:hypothetical protein
VAASATRTAVAGLLDADRPGAERLAVWESPRPGLITRTARLADGRRAVFLINWTTGEQACRAPAGMIPLGAPATASPATAFTVTGRSGLLLVSA